MRSNAPLPELITLRQAALWVGFGLWPQEDLRLEVLDGYPRRLADICEVEGRDEAQGMVLDAVKAEIARWLIQGHVQAFGRPEVDEEALRPRYEIPESMREQPEVYQEMLIAAAEEGLPLDPVPTPSAKPLERIPADWWDPDAIRWDEGVAVARGTPGPGQVPAYVDVRLRAEEVQRLRRLHVKASASAVAEPATRGPKPRHDEAEFFLLLACEADVNGLPSTQAGLERRMLELMAAARDDDDAATASETVVPAGEGRRR